MKNKKPKGKTIEVSTNDAEILFKVANSATLPEIAKEMIAVRSGIVDEEGIIPRKAQFEAFINNERWINIQERDSRWQRDVKIEIPFVNKKRIKLFLKGDFILIDDTLNTVSVVISDFSCLSEKRIKQTYSKIFFLIKKAGKAIWNKYKINCYILQYDSNFYDYEDETWRYDPERSSCVQIKKSTPFPIEKALDKLNKFAATITEYKAKAIPFDDLSIEAQHSIDDLRTTELYARLSIDALNRIGHLYNYNKRRIRRYIQDDCSLCLLKEQMDRLNSDFNKLYTALMNSD